MKRYIVNFSVILLLAFNGGTVAAEAIYAQLSSRQDQLATMDTINKGIVVEINNVDSIAGMSFDAKTNELAVKEEGIYFLMAVAQVGAREYAGAIVKGGDIYFWIEMNKKAIENSANWIFASPSARAHTIVDQMILPCKKGDLIRFKFATSSPSMGLITFGATEKWPASPGITLSVYKIN